jgi:hypothetical protein
MSDCYQLDGHEVVKVATHAWRLEPAWQRRVGFDEIGDVVVSTVFLGLDHGYGGGPPLIFETQIVASESRVRDLDQWQERYSTWEAAERGHAEAVRMVKERLEGC